MSLKAELEIWAAALAAYDAENFEQALELFSQIADTSKIFTNIGLIYATLGDHETAVEQFFAATQLDQYLAVAYFQCGVSNFLLTRYELALKDFEEALMYLRGNQAINYEQLGLNFRLYSAEVLFNRGLALIYMGRVEEGLADMEDARREKKTEEHGVIDEAIQDKGQGYTVFSIPVGVLYRPSENKLKNAKQKDYLGKAKLVATEDVKDAYTTFSGVTRLRQGITPQGIYADDLQPPPDLSESVAFPLPKAASDPTALQRSKTTRGSPSTTTPATGPPLEGGTNGRTVARGPTIRRQNSSPDIVRRNLSIKPSVVSGEKEQGADERQSPGLYDDYIDSYRDSGPRRPSFAPSRGTERGTVASWARVNANPNNFPPSRSLSRKSPSSFSPRSPSVRRKYSRSQPVNQPVNLYEEEEGYASGDFDDASTYELAKIRVKVHYQGEVRGMALTLDVPFEEFMDRLAAKFGLVPNMLDVKFKDEDGGKVSLKDESDYDMAIETVKGASQGQAEGRMEIWCTNA